MSIFSFNIIDKSGKLPVFVLFCFVLFLQHFDELHGLCNQIA